MHLSMVFPLSNTGGLQFDILFLANGTCYLNSLIASECCKPLYNSLWSCVSVYLKLFYMSFSSGEDDARQVLAPCPKRLPGHCSTNALPEINQLPRAGGGVSSDHLHLTCPRSPGAATAVPGILDPQCQRLPASGRRVQDMVPAR